MSIQKTKIYKKNGTRDTAMHTNKTICIGLTVEGFGGFGAFTFSLLFFYGPTSRHFLPMHTPHERSRGNLLLY